jgi:thiol-disulfide isomerase/thioredoxin
MRKIFLLLSLLVAGSISASAQKALKVGQVMSNLALLNTNEVIYDLNAQKGVKGFILVFMTPTCDHCRAYEKRIVALHKKYKPKRYELVAIGPYGDDPVKFPLDAMPEMKKLAKEKGFQFPYLSDTHFQYTWLLGIKITPTAVVLQKVPKGYLIKYIGAIDDQQDEKLTPKHKYVEQVVDKLL